MICSYIRKYKEYGEECLSSSYTEHLPGCKLLFYLSSQHQRLWLLLVQAGLVTPSSITSITGFTATWPSGFSSFSSFVRSFLPPSLSFCLFFETGYLSVTQTPLHPVSTLESWWLQMWVNRSADFLTVSSTVFDSVAQNCVPAVPSVWNIFRGCNKCYYSKVASSKMPFWELSPKPSL